MFRVQVSCVICTAATLGLVWSIFSTGKGSLSMHYLYIPYKIMCTGMKTYMGGLRYVFILGVYYQKGNICALYQPDRKKGRLLCLRLSIYLYSISIYHGHFSYRSSTSSGKEVL